MTVITIHHGQKFFNSAGVKTLAAILLPAALLFAFIMEPRLLYASFALAAVFTYGALLNIFIFNRCNEMHLMLNIVLEKIYKIM
ncbi:MAG: hypothetical protein LUG14_06575 [Synergistaceae bacterium]|nr:hypothetical protein [Synergistaceae bacterium]